jgi:hypothetical protein
MFAKTHTTGSSGVGNYFARTIAQSQYAQRIYIVAVKRVRVRTLY